MSPASHPRPLTRQAGRGSHRRRELRAEEVDGFLGAPARAGRDAEAAGASPRLRGRAPRPSRAHRLPAAAPASARRGGRSSPAPGASRLSFGETTSTSPTCGSISSLLPGVAGHLERHPVSRAQALHKQLELLRLGLNPPRGTDFSILRDRHLAELEMDVQPNSPRLLLLPFAWRANRWANDIDAFALTAQPDKSQGRPPKSPGSNTPIVVEEPACPAAFSRRPLPHSADHKPRPGRQPSRSISCRETQRRGLSAKGPCDAGQSRLPVALTSRRLRTSRRSA